MPAQQKTLKNHEYRLLLGAILKKSPEWVFMHLPSLELSDTQQKVLDQLIKRRLAGEPIAKILGFREFYGRNFFTNQHTLDPRPDSETLIDAISANHNQDQPLRILDLGLGTGCLLFTLLCEYPNAIGIGVDFSFETLKIAKQNQQNLRLEERSLIIQGDWAQAVEGMFDIIVSNPPYIGTKETLDQSTLFDPSLALFGGKSGLEAYQQIMPQLAALVKPNGRVYLEIGQNQNLCVENIASQAGLNLEGTFKDLSGTTRVLCYSSHKIKI